MTRVTSFRWASRSFAWLALVALLACSPQPKTASNSTESTWQQQLDAVLAGDTDRIEISRQTVGDDQLAALAKATGLRELVLEKSAVTDDGLAALGHLDNLQHIKLVGSAVGNDGVRRLVQHQKLNIVNLPDAMFTDDGFALLAQASRLGIVAHWQPLLD